MNDVTISKTDLVSIIEETGITNMIKPLIREIFLFDTFVAGTAYNDPSIYPTLKKDDTLLLRREQENKYDTKAILVTTQDGVKLGYIPRKDNHIFSRLLDAGKLLSAKVISSETKENFPLVKIAIYLIDF